VAYLDSGVGLYNSERSKGQTDQHKFAVGQIYFMLFSLKEILERQLIICPKSDCCNIFCNWESSLGPHATQSVWCAGLL